MKKNWILALAMITVFLCSFNQVMAHDAEYSNLMKKADIAFSAGNFPRSLELALQASQKEITSSSLLLVSHCQVRMKQPDAAISTLDKAIRIANDKRNRKMLSKLYWQKANILYLKEKYQLAAYAYTQAYTNEDDTIRKQSLEIARYQCLNLY